MNNRSTVCKVANKLAKKMSKSEAFKTAWALVKGQTAAVQDVAVGRRQTVLAHLSRYAAADVTVELKPDYRTKNRAVFATVQGKGSYLMGYLNRQQAAAARLVASTGYRSILLYRLLWAVV